MSRTEASRVLGIEYPIVQAGMARTHTSAHLVAAVSEAGGLGTLGCLGRPAAEAVAEIGRIRELTTRPFSVNFVLHRCDEKTFAACLAERVPIFTFFRGDPTAATARAHQAGALVLCQVTTLSEARLALQAGADMLIAQGQAAGGHMGPLPLHTFLPAVVAVAQGRPVLAAGGIVDGAGLAAMLCLGASGVVIGTRFLATPEAPTLAEHKQAILDAAAGDTVASSIFDTIWGEEWPGVQARGVRNNLATRWLGHEGELSAVRVEALTQLQEAESRHDIAEMIVLAGEGAGLIHDLRPAGELVREIATEAEAILTRLAATGAEQERAAGAFA